MNLCYYISDYGYGHASRSIAIINGLLNCPEKVNIFIKTGTAFEFLSRSLNQKSVKIIQCKTDIGVIFPKNCYNVDVIQTKKMLMDWHSSWLPFIKKEKKFCENNKIDLILSDVPPQPLIVGADLKIPSVLISNFTWYYIYYHLFGNVDVVLRLRDAYSLSNLCLALPFTENMNYIKNKRKVGLVSRKVSSPPYDIRRRYGISSNDLLIFLSVGKSFDSMLITHITKFCLPNVKFLVSSHVDILSKNVIKIPFDETETQNYVASCDLVISKAGYSTVAEAISAKVPIFLFEREGFYEDLLMQNEIKKMGIGTVLPVHSLINGDWIKELANLSNYKSRYVYIDKKYRIDGTAEVVNNIIEYMV